MSRAGLPPAPVDGLVAVGADGDDRDSHACELLEEVDVVLCLARELVEVPHARDVAVPAGKRLVDGLRVVEDALMLRNRGVALAVALVGDADLDLVQAAQYVELGDGEVGEAVDSGGVVDDDGVVPATATLAASGDACLLYTSDAADEL